MPIVLLNEDYARKRRDLGNSAGDSIGQVSKKGHRRNAEGKKGKIKLAFNKKKSNRNRVFLTEQDCQKCFILHFLKSYTSLIFPEASHMYRYFFLDYSYYKYRVLVGFLLRLVKPKRENKFS